jgi:hypothetical protein
LSSFVGDPVGSGFVSNDARPNGNLTGFANRLLARADEVIE